MRLVIATTATLATLTLAACTGREAETTQPAPPAAASGELAAPAESEAARARAALDADPSSLSATLSGAEEAPGPGDVDGKGTASVTLDRDQGQVCYELTVEGIGTATAAHIHSGLAGASGPPVVTLDAPAQGSSKGCAAAEGSVLQDLEENPSAFYVNVHNAEFPQGAVRGQLSAGQ